MPKKLLLSALASLCLFSACKKSSDSTAKSGPRPKLYIEDVHIGTFNETDTFTLSYDADARLINMASPKLRFAYTYVTNSSFTLDLYENGALSIHEIGWVNSNSVIDSTFQYNNTQDSTTEKYIYTGTQLTRKMTYSYTHFGATIENRDLYTYDNGGNMTKDVQDDGFGNINTITTYTYTNNPVPFTVGNSFAPPASKNLIATMTVADGNGNVSGVVTYSYAFDSAGRLTKETDTQGTAGYVIKSYVY